MKKCLQIVMQGIKQENLRVFDICKKRIKSKTLILRKLLNRFNKNIYKFNLVNLYKISKNKENILKN